MTKKNAVLKAIIKAFESATKKSSGTILRVYFLSKFCDILVIFFGFFCESFVKAFEFCFGFFRLFLCGCLTVGLFFPSRRNFYDRAHAKKIFLRVYFVAARKSNKADSNQ